MKHAKTLGHKALRILFIAVLSVGAQAAVALQAPWAYAASKAPNVAPYTAFYGVYVGGQKVGWMRSTYVAAPTPTLSYTLQAEVRGMGRVTPITLEETRTYHPRSQALQHVTFVQTSDSGAVRVVGERKGTQFVVRVLAGGATHQATLAVGETLSDALAVHALVASPNAHMPKVGDHTTSQHFDPATQKMGRATLRIDAVAERLLGGVQSTVYTVTTAYPDMGVSEQSTLDGTGQVLQTQMGGFFEAKREPKEIAQKKELVQDVLVQAVVPTPKPIDHADTLTTLDVTLSGFDDAPPPSSDRQQVSKTDAGWRLQMRKDAPLIHVPYRPKHVPAHEPDAVLQARKPTAFIQSDAKEIVAAAKEAVGATQDTQTAIALLVTYVRSHLRPEYVPAFSNALEALHTGKGDCTEHSVLFVALARAAKIPARTVVGVAYWPPAQGFGWHAWAEVYADGRWVSVDPTWGQTISDPTHLKLADGGPQEQARVVMLLGRLHVLAIHWA